MVTLLVGDRADPHARAVADGLPASGLVVVDAASIDSVVKRVDLTGSLLRDASGTVIELGGSLGGRGWLRRLSPAAWGHGVAIGSHPAAVPSSRMSLLAALLRDQSIEWVTAVDDLYAAENKIVQYRVAYGAGVRVPRTVVCRDAEILGAELGEPFVLKPLGPGNFEVGGQQHVVFVGETSVKELATVDLMEAPFLAQELVDALWHLRVVTVQGESWTAELDATGLPRDWREHGPAHHAFRATTRWPDVQALAVSLATSMNVGFSSQDWVVDRKGPVFLDLNPSGQWLFLPDAVADQVTNALVAWLAGNQ